MYMVTPASDASKMAVGHFSKIFDSGENGLQLNYDSVTRLKNESAANGKTFLSAFTRNVFITRHGCDTRHTRRWSECKIDHTLCQGDLAFFCNCPRTLENMRLWTHERTPCIPRHVDDLETVEFADVLGSIAEDQHLTRCPQVCFTDTEEDQAERHDQETIDEVLGDQDMEEGGDVLEEADREADLLEQMPLPFHPESEKERLASWLRLPRRARVAITR